MGLNISQNISKNVSQNVSQNISQNITAENIIIRYIHTTQTVHT
jgi:hypothetical protein